MISTPAGSPTCNCKNPDTCIHAFTLTADGKTYSYKQDSFVSSIDMINKKDNPIPLKMVLTGKSCVANNPKCPDGMIYNLEKKDSLKTFEKGNIDYDVDFDRLATDRLATINAIDFINQYVLHQNSALNWLPKNQYVLRVAQCYGDHLIDKDISFIDGVKQIFNLAPHDRIWSLINVYPGFSWNVNLTIGVGQKVTEYTDDELKKQQRKENKDAGNASRDTRGWTKRPRYSITESLEIEGSLYYLLGAGPKHDFSQKLKIDFKKKAKELTLLQDATKALDLVGKAISTNEGTGVKYKILNTDILYPKLSIIGNAELALDNESKSAFMKGKISVGFAPLIGMRITFDLLQAFAAWYGVASVTDAIRQQLAERENSVKDGNNGAYAGLKFDLIASGTINLSLILESNIKREWNWRVDGASDVKLSLSLEANARAGVKIYVFEGAFEVYAKAIAEGMIAVELSAKNIIEMTFYHNGIRAEVGASFSGGISGSQSDSGKKGETRDAKRSTETRSKGSEGQKREWIIHDKLEKKNSKYRFSLL